ncbi:MAG: hypothetical protein ACLQDF_15280 [Desulfomonilia bacterium]
MEKLIEFIIKEWKTVSATPFTFVILAVLFFLLAYGVSSWRYQGIIDLLREQLAQQKQRTEAKDDQIVEYRERLHLVPSDTTEFSKYTNKELQEKAFAVVNVLRKYLVEVQERQNSILFSDKKVSYQSMSEEERNKAWSEETKRLMVDSLKTSTDYDTRFKVDAILLRDELLSRLPKGSKNEKEYWIYEHPTNPIGMGMVADDLERMAKLLPININ